MTSSSQSLLTLSWLAYLPVGCVILVGLILSAVFWERSPRPALLTLLAMVVLLATTVGQPWAQSALVSARGAAGTDFRQSILMVAIAFNAARALAYGLLFAAAFVGRRSSAQPPAFDGSPRIL